jgi:hypothetical protein
MKFIGVILIVAAILGLRIMLPKNGKVHRLATAPVLEDVIPFAMTAGLFVGLVLILAS